LLGLSGGSPFLLSAPAVIDETVKVAKKFLEDHPEEAGKYGQVQKHVSTETPFVGKRIIANFLGWNEDKVRFSLERLNLIDTGAIDKEVIEMFETEGSARTFTHGSFKQLFQFNFGNVAQ
jgi:hypothetical protein